MRRFAVLVLLTVNLANVVSAQPRGMAPFSDEEVWALASAQYIEIQRAIVRDCKSRWVVDHSQLQGQFEAVYRSYFQGQVSRAQRSLAKLGMAYSEFVQATVFANIRSLTPTSCRQMGQALALRTSDESVVQRGIQNQYGELRRGLPR